MKKIFSFLNALSKNNNREWFHEHKEEYLAAKNEFEQIAVDIIHECKKFDPSLKDVNTKECFFRIFRDVRFSKNKEPYKTNFGCFFKEGGKKSVHAGYYLHIQPKQCFLAGGIYQPEKNTLNKILKSIDVYGDELEKIVHAKNFKQHFKKIEDGGESLKKVPLGFDSDHPFAEWLKMKSFLVRYGFNDNEVMENNFSKNAVLIYKQMFPFVNWINHNLEQE